MLFVTVSEIDKRGLAKKVHGSEDGACATKVHYQECLRPIYRGTAQVRRPRKTTSGREQGKKVQTVQEMQMVWSFDAKGTNIPNAPRRFRRSGAACQKGVRAI